MKETMNTQNTSKTRVLSPAEVVLKIREEAKNNEVFNAVCTVFAVRERTRAQVTLQTLRLILFKEGYLFKPEQLAKALEFLASLGIGKLERDRKGNVAVLKNISVTLQSIGLAGISHKDTLDRFDQAKTFKPLSPELQKIKRAPVQAAPLKTAPTPVPPTQVPVSLSIDIDGKKVTLDISSIINNILKKD